MADSSDEYEPEEGPTDTSSGRTLRRRKANDDTQVSGGNPAKKKAKYAPTQRTSLPTNLGAIAGMENDISERLKGLDIDKNMSLRIMRAVLREQKRYLEVKQKVGKKKGASVPMADVSDKVCSFFSISPPTYCRIVQEYLTGISVYKSGIDDLGSSGNNPKKATSAPAQQTSLPTNLQAIAGMENHISKQLKGLDIDKNMSLRVMQAVLREQKRYLEVKQEVGKKKGASVPRAGVRDKVCSFFSISSPTYGSIVREYLTGRSVYKSGIDDLGRSGNRQAKDQRIPQTKEVQIKVREFIREQRKDRKRVTGRQVTDFLISANYLQVPRDAEGRFEKRPFDSAYRTVRNWLQRQKLCREDDDDNSGDGEEKDAGDTGEAFLEDV